MAYAKANPGKLGQPFVRGLWQSRPSLAAELLLARAGIKAVHVPYKSGAEMVTAVLSEQVQMSFPDVSILLPLIADKKVKALAVTSARRHPQLPDVPTMAEAGIPDYVTTFWTGVIMPAGTPADIVAKLNSALDAGLKSQLVADSLGKVGAEPAPGTPQEFGDFIASETRKWSAIARTAGLEPCRAPRYNAGDENGPGIDFRVCPCGLRMGARRAWRTPGRSRPRCQAKSGRHQRTRNECAGVRGEYEAPEGAGSSAEGGPLSPHASCRQIALDASGPPQSLAVLIPATIQAWPADCLPVVGEQQWQGSMAFRKCVLYALAAFVLAAASGNASADDYPSRPITIIVPVAAGGSIDYLARLVGQKLSERLGKPLVVENKPGGGMTIGAAAAAKAQPDGYTMLMGTSTPLAINVTVHKALSYDQMKISSRLRRSPTARSRWSSIRRC